MLAQETPLTFEIARFTWLHRLDLKACLTSICKGPLISGPNFHDSVSVRLATAAGVEFLVTKNHDSALLTN
jgi:hypothetical protein